MRLPLTTAQAGHHHSSLHSRRRLHDTRRRQQQQRRRMERRRARIRPRAATTAVIGNNDDQRPSEGRHPLRRFEPPTPLLRALVLATVVLCVGLRAVDAFRPPQGCPGPVRARSWPALALPDDARTCAWMTSSSSSRAGRLITPLAATRGGVDGLERHLAASLWEDEGEEEDDEEAPVEQLLNPRGAAQPPAAPRRRGRPRKAEVVLIEEGGEEEAEEATRTRRQAPQLPASVSAGKGATSSSSSSSSSSAARFLPTVSRGSARRGLPDGALDAAIAQKAPGYVRPSNKREERLLRLEAMLAAADQEEGGDDDDAAGAEEGPATAAAARAHTVDLYVPPADLEVMLAWADRLMERRLEGRAQWSLPPGAATAASEEAEGEQGRGGRRGKQQRPGQGQRAGSKALVALSKEQRLLSLAQMFVGMEKLRAEMADAEPGPGAVTLRELAGRLGLRPSEVEAFYKLGLRARSYILMSMHGLILSLARRYAAAFGDAVDKAELVQEGYKGAMLAVERYDPVKAATSGATFRAFAHVYVMSAMITAARKELHLSPSGASAPPAPRDPALLRLPPGTPAPSPRGRGLLLPSSSAAAAAGAAVPRLGMGRSDNDGAGVGALASAAWEHDDEEEEGQEGQWLGTHPEDEEELLEAASDAAPVRRPGRRPLRKIRRVARFGIGQEAAVDGLGAGGGRRAELFGVDPAASRPAYEILDESKRARDVGLFLARAAQELAPLDMQVLSLVYGLDGNVPMKRAQVARKLGLHASAVAKSEKRALRKLREMLQIA